jgi:preprotein translocase subunit SecD
MYPAWRESLCGVPYATSHRRTAISFLMSVWNSTAAASIASAGFRLDGLCLSGAIDYNAENLIFRWKVAMLYFSRGKVAAILVTTLVICSFVVPNFLSDKTVKNWPTWAQRHLVLGVDLQGGTLVQLEVDRKDVRAQILESLHRDVRGALHEARIDLVRPVALRGDAIEVRPLEASFRVALAKLHELSLAFSGARPADVVDAGGGLIRVTPTDDALAEREQQIIDRLIPIMKARMNRMGIDGTVEQKGARRFAIEVPGIGLAEKFFDGLQYE